MNNIFEITFCIIEMLIFFFYFNGVLGKKKHIKFEYGIVFIVSCALNIARTYLYLSFALNITLSALMMFVITLICFDGAPLRKIFFTAINICALMISEMITALFLSSVLHIDYDDGFSARYLGCLINLSILFVLNLYVIYIAKQKYRQLPLKYNLLMVFCPILSIAILMLLDTYISISANSLYIWSAFAVLGLGYINIMIFDFFDYYEKGLKARLLEQQNENLKRSIANDKAFVKKMKSLRHDINNHNIAIKAFFENGDCTAGLEYMKNIGQQLNITNDIIETGNVALDAIINAKKTVAQNKGFEFITNIQIPENVFVDETDLCTIFGNALDNCIEACEQITNRERKISVSIVYDDNSLICKITNTAINLDNDLLTTTKQDKENHGFGISNIKAALSKYNNVCRFKQTETEFILSFVIFNN